MKNNIRTKNDIRVKLREELAGSLGEVLMYLTACALNDTVPDKNVYSGVDSKLIYLGARCHTIESMVAFALEKNGYDGIDPDIARRFRTDRDKAVRKNMLLDAERGRIISFMENEKIRHISLKGIVLQSLYPEYGMRQMADNDILYDEKYQMKLKDFMVSRGFRAEYVGKSVHDCYYKEPVYNYEMHTKLFDDSVGDGILADYYKYVWSRAIKDTDREYGYHFSDEDFYVYVTAHAKKHHAGSGTGIRTLADFLVMNRTFSEADREYINAELDKTGLSDFEQKISFFADRLLSKPEKTIATINSFAGKKEMSELRYILTSGTYGTKEYSIMNRMRKISGKTGRVTAGTKICYFVKRAFPDRKQLYSYYPPARFRVFVPFVWMFRILRGVTFRAGRVFREIRIALGQKEI